MGMTKKMLLTGLAVALVLLLSQQVLAAGTPAAETATALCREPDRTQISGQDAAIVAIELTTGSAPPAGDTLNTH